MQQCSHRKLAATFKAGLPVHLCKHSIRKALVEVTFPKDVQLENILFNAITAYVGTVQTHRPLNPNEETDFKCEHFQDVLRNNFTPAQIKTAQFDISTRWR